MKKGAQIGIDVTSAVTQGGGIGRYTRELIFALLQEDKQSAYRLFHAKMPATLPVPNPIPTAPNATNHPAPISDKWLYRLWYRLHLPLPIQWVTGELDLFHSPDFTLPPIQGNIPTLLTVHDLSFVHFPDTFTPALVNYLNGVVPRSVQRATHILADSQATKRDLMGIWNTPSDKITVLLAGVNERFQPETDEQLLTAVRAKYKLGDAPYLLSLGTIHPRKNYQMLIKAFKQIAEQYPHNLYIAGGKGWLYEPVFAEIEAQGLTERVRFIGFVDDDDLPALYSAATLFLFPSLYEGFGLPLLEAMGCGVPVVTSNASSLPEVAGDSARQLDPTAPHQWTTAIAQLLDQPEQRAKMVSTGFLQARRFSWHRSARKLLDLYQMLLKG